MDIENEMKEKLKGVSNVGNSKIGANKKMSYFVVRQGGDDIYFLNYDKLNSIITSNKRDNDLF